MRRSVVRPHYSVVLLLFITMAVGFLPLIGFIAHGIEKREDEALAQEKLRLSEHAESLAMAVDRELRSQVELARSLATNRALHAGDLDGFWQTAHAVAQVVGGNFVLIDRDLQQLVNTRVPFGTPLPRTADVESTLKVFSSGQPLIGNLQTGAVSKQQLFAVRVPVRINDQVTYSLSYVARPDSILGVVEQLFRPQGWVASVLDANGNFVARSLNHARLYGKPVQPHFHLKTEAAGLALENDMDGRKAYAAFYRSPYSGWTFLIWAPRHVLEGPSNTSWRNLYVSLGLAIVIAFLAALVANQLIRRPTMTLLDAAHELASGKPVSFRPTLMGEANVVGAALSEASDAIQYREHALREREQRLTVLLRELSHRTKNLLAVIQAMASQSMRTAKDMNSFRRAFRNRLASLSRSHDLLLQESWGNIGLAELVQAQIEPFTAGNEDRVNISGPPISVKPQVAQTLGMALHELGANAVTHGSLGTPHGRVAVSWTVSDDAEPGLSFRWREAGGPPCASPSHSGFGETVLLKIVPAALFGEAAMKWHEDGCEWVLEAPVSAIMACKAQRQDANNAS